EASDHEAAVEQGDRIPWGWVVGTAIGLEVALIISAVAWVAIYSYLIHPGEEPAYYHDYAQYSSPVVSVVLGMPLWYFACRWVGRKAGTRAVAMCGWAWFILFLIDFPLNSMSELQAYNWTMVAISLSTKLVAAYLGGRAALKSVS
ncbi:MAG TPA: hypothetical protein VLU47_08985, partial [Blastocatellia bacterium]|nr:hypothetical protein [Blastocatellia bacterium]